MCNEDKHTTNSTNSSHRWRRTVLKIRIQRMRNRFQKNHKIKTVTQMEQHMENRHEASEIHNVFRIKIVEIEQNNKTTTAKTEISTMQKIIL